MIKNVLSEAWRYWKWLCVTMMTTTILLMIATWVLGGFKDQEAQELSPSEQCLDDGGRWNAETSDCEHAA